MDQQASPIDEKHHLHHHHHDFTSDLPPPAYDQAYMDVSALEAGLIDLPSFLTVEGASSSEVRTVPSLAFLLTQSKTKERIVFDLGLRRDVDAYAPYVQMMIEKYMPVQVPQSVDESLRKGGLNPEDVKTVVLSHLHFDQYVLF